MPNYIIKELLNTFHQSGTIDWIGIRHARRQPLQAVESVLVDENQGILDDHYSGANGKRHVTLIQAEHLDAVGKILGTKVSPMDVRRNLVVSGLNLLALNNKQFKLGEEVVLEMTGQCHPCTRMEENLGKGAYNAMRGHGGITARVVKGGTLRIGDRLEPLKSRE